MIDLQIHTSATPGHATWEPETLAEAASRAGLQTIAVTDHNTTSGVAAAQAAGARHGVRVIAGVEIDSGFPAGGRAGGQIRMWHTLIYGAAPDNPQLTALCRAVFERNAADAARLREELTARGYQLRGLDALGRPPNVAEVGAALARHNTLPGRVPGEDDESAGMRYILTELPGGYRPVGVDEVIRVAHAAGGLAVLAHPGRSKGIYAIPAEEADVAAMAAAGLDGIEVFYPAHSPEQQQFYLALAQRHRLLITGGSDSHGPHQPFMRIDPNDLRIAPGSPTILELIA
ncbi:MAG: PHP domain-containing protein [Chloroflexota bacterium]|nr:MAG: phosphotransferase [Chloroflexota bacterium]